MDYTEPRIVTSDDLTKRSYILFYINGERYREPNGKCLGLNLQPNRAKTIDERNKLLRKLEFEIRKALEAQAFPYKEIIQANDIIETKDVCIATTKELLDAALSKKLNSKLNKFYKRNLKRVCNDFIQFLSTEELKGEISKIKPSRIEEFLSRYKTSGTYYMNKRRDLGVLFSTAAKQVQSDLKAVLQTETMKSKARLHMIYESDQVKPILNFLKKAHPNLHTCCLLTYGCFLRPHEEVRNLTKRHFKKDFTEIHLSGDENKGGRVRVVYVPDYIRKHLTKTLDSLQLDDNIFSHSPTPFNDAYFNTAWTRA